MSVHLAPAERSLLQGLASEVSVQHAVFGALQLLWEVNESGFYCSTRARVVPTGSPPGSPSVDGGACAHRLDHESLLEAVRNNDRSIAVRMLGALARSALLAHASHEIDEMLLVSGCRLFDPHGPNGEPAAPIMIDSCKLARLDPPLDCYCAGRCSSDPGGDS